MLELEKMPLDELKKLQKDVTKAIDTFEERARKAALAEVEAVARMHGFAGIDQLLGKGAPSKPRKPAVAKYANPADKTQTWSGRGRKPAWVIEALDAGKALADLEI
ncbi:MAG: H-NS histone family protein [Roseinatronobacter sp.]